MDSEQVKKAAEKYRKVNLDVKDNFYLDKKKYENLCKKVFDNKNTKGWKSKKLGKMFKNKELREFIEFMGLI